MNADEKTFVKGLILGMRMRAKKEREGGRLEYADGMKYVIDEIEGIFFGDPKAEQNGD